MGLSLQLEIRKDDTHYARVTLYKMPARIGSSRNADIRLDDPDIAPEHIEVLKGPRDIVLIRDLSGTGGIRINGVRLNQAEIRPGDSIELGGFVLHVIEAHITREVIDPENYIHANPPSDAAGAELVELYVLWKGRVLQAEHMAPGTEYTVGVRPGVDILVPDDVLDVEAFPLLVGGSGAELTIGQEGLSGSVRHADGKIEDLAELQKTQSSVSMEEGFRARLDLDDFTFLVSVTRAVPPQSFTVIERINAIVALCFALSFFGHLSFMIGLTLIPEDALLLSQTDYRRRQQVIEVIQIAHREELKKEEEKEERIKAKRIDKKKASDGDEKIKTKEKDIDTIVSKLTPEERLKKTKELALKSGLAAEINNQTALIAETLSSGANVLSASNSLRALVADSAEGDSDLSSLDPFGGAVGQLGGGAASGGLTAVLAGAAGGMGVAGLSKTELSEENVNVKFKKAKRSSKIISSGKFQVSGGYDKKIIRQYIRKHLRQLQWCHQKAIQKNPNVGGKVVVKMVIMPTGKVLKPSIDRSTVGSRELEQCLLSKIRLWNFPKPKRSGTTAVVRYPFIFKVVK